MTVTPFVASNEGATILCCELIPVNVWLVTLAQFAASLDADGAATAVIRFVLTVSVPVTVMFVLTFRLLNVVCANTETTSDRYSRIAFIFV